MTGSDWKVVRARRTTGRVHSHQNHSQPHRSRRSAQPHSIAEPEIRRSATLTCLRSADVVDVLTPAWSVRQVCSFLPEAIDLSLSRSLTPLQSEDGGFELSRELVAALGLRDPMVVIEASGSESSRLIGSLLVLKTAAVYCSNSWDLCLDHICSGAMEHCRQHLGITESRLWDLIQQVEDATVDVAPLPRQAVALLRANFGSRVLWSQCDLWMRLLTPAAKSRLQHSGGVLCPRNFLVDLATVSRCPHNFHSTYLLYMQDGRLYVGTVAADHELHDALRQGRQLEAGVVSFGWLEEDRVLTELMLPNGLLACYSGAPDALAEYAETAAVPLTAGDEAGYRAAGYELQEDTGATSEAGPRIRFWRALNLKNHASSGAYVEIKKTTNLKGAGGEYKRSKYWMQAALAGCAGVLIATTEHSEDGTTASTFQRLSLEDLASTVRDHTTIWSDLAAQLAHIMAITQKGEGAWTLSLRKSKGEAVDLKLHRGWTGDEGLHDKGHISRAEDSLSDFTRAGDRARENGHWEMECGSRWSYWNPEGVEFMGSPGEVVHFKINNVDYRAVFGSGKGYQENLSSGRQQRLRFIAAKVEPTKEVEDDVVHQLCDMGFSHFEVLRCLQAAEGNPARAVEYLITGAGAFEI